MPDGGLFRSAIRSEANRDVKLKRSYAIDDPLPIASDIRHLSSIAPKLFAVIDQASVSRKGIVRRTNASERFVLPGELSQGVDERAHAASGIFRGEGMSGAICDLILVLVDLHVVWGG